jgi:hypothetical protein
MKALDLYKFVTTNNVEYHWHDSDVILFISNYLLDDWNKLLGNGITDENGLSCVMKDGYFCFMMQDICDYYDIDINEIFEKENN